MSVSKGKRSTHFLISKIRRNPSARIYKEALTMEENKKNNKNGRKVGMVLSLAAAAGLVFGGTSYAAREAVDYLVKETKTETTQTAAAEETQEAKNLLSQNGTVTEQETAETQKNETAANEEADENTDEAVNENQNAIASQPAGEAQVLTNTPSKQEMSVADVSEYVMPAMVAITNTSVETLNDYFGNYGGMDLFGMFGFGGGFGGYGNGGNGGDQTFEAVSKGSGEILAITDDKIYIATNAHVVENANKLSVTFIDEESYEGTVVGADEDNDLAVVSVDLADVSEDTLSQIKAIDIGDSDAMRIGEQVVAIGNALGYGQSTSVGYLSAKNRALDSSKVEGGLLQTDAAINPGNSGGALLNMYGQLIGINSSKYADTEVEGMGFAIPINYAQPILQDMVENGTGSAEEADELFGDNENGWQTPFSGEPHEYPFEDRQNGENEDKNDAEEADPDAVYMGIECYTVSEQTAAYYGVPTGIIVKSVVNDMPAETAGLEAGDIITAIDGNRVTSMEELQEILEDYEPGDTVELTVSRADFSGNYHEGTVELTFTSRAAA